MLEVDPDLYDGQNGRVKLLPSGQILVDTATDERQAEIAALMEAIASRAPAETPTVSLRYWVLRGLPGTDDAADLPAALDGVVRELEAVHGELGFSIVDAAVVTGQSGRSASYQNDQWDISQLAHANGDRLNAYISLEQEAQNVEQFVTVELNLTRGQFLVLGAGTSQSSDSTGVLAVIVNWPEGD
jgi:hypothetical protein